MQNSLLTQLRVLRIKQTRLEKDPPTETEIEAAENALCDWQEFKGKVDSIDADVLAGRADRQDLLGLAEKDNDDVINALASVLEDAPEALKLVLARVELEHAEREYYRFVMAQSASKKTKDKQV